MSQEVEALFNECRIKGKQISQQLKEIALAIERIQNGVYSTNTSSTDIGRRSLGNDQGDLDKEKPG